MATINPQSSTHKPQAPAAAPSEAVDAPASGSKTPQTHPVAINDLETKFGWKKDSWQDQLLHSADAAGDKDGNVTAAEIDGYSKNPEDLKFVNSERLQQFRGDFGDGAKPKTVDSFKPGFEQNLAKAADQLGNKDGNLSAGELTSFVAQMK